MTSNITILIPHYNNYNDLCVAVSSCKDFSVLIVDDGSSNYEKGQFPVNVSEICLNKNLGVANARNILVRNCSTKYGVFLDSDDRLVDLTYIQEAVSLLQKSDAAVAGCNAILSTGRNQTRPKRIHLLYFLWRDPIITSGAVFDVEKIRQFNFSDPTSEKNFAEDYFFWAKVRSSYEMLNLEKFAVERKVRVGSILSRVSLLRRIKAAIIVRMRIAWYFISAY